MFNKLVIVHKVYQCPDGAHYLGYPYNSGIPIVPPPGQNNEGRGYSNEEDVETIN
jgi:hypothetical protein